MAEAEKLDAFVKYQLTYEREAFRREEVEDLALSHVQTLETVFYLYLRDRNFEQDCLGRTLSAMQSILSNYGDTEIEQVDREVLADMLKTLSAAGLKGGTISRKMGIVKAVLNWALRNNYIKSVPLFPVMPKIETARNVPPSPDEVAALYRVALPHLRRVIILGFMFGMRVGPCELFRLRWSDIDIPSRVIRVPNAKKGNTDPWREVPIKQSLMALIENWKAEDKACASEYVVTYKGKPIRSIRKAWKETLQRAGIKRYLRPYDLRHAFATEAIAAGADYGTVAALMGHKSPMMVLRHYQHVKTRQKLMVIESLPQPELAAASV
ncbi:MAG: site-specific integrase [Desulfovibrio sp.]|nr:site-specific integrase [Desulfovibrio sp.]